MGADVAIRLGLRGGTAVEKGLRDIGREGRASMRELETAAKGLPPHMIAVSRSVGAVKDGVSSLAAQAGPAGRVLGSFGTIGLAAAAGIAAVGLAVTAAFHQAREAMVFADNLEDMAAQIGVTTDFLQEMRYAIRVTGGDAEKADEQITNFVKNFGAARDGLSPKALRPFEALGFSREDLQNARTAEAMLPRLADAVAELDKEARLAALSKLGIADWGPLLATGSAGLEKLMTEAHALGLVMDKDLIKRAAKANDEFETAAQIISIQLKSAFVDLGPVIVSLMNLVAGLARAVGDVAQAFQTLDKQSSAHLERRLKGLERHRAELDRGLYSRGAKDRADARIAEVKAELAARKAAPDEVVEPPRGDTLVDTSKPSGVGKTKDKAQQRQDRFEDALAEAEQRLLGLYREREGSIEQDLVLDLELLELKRKERLVALARQVRDGDMTQLEADQLSAAEDKADALEAENLRTAAFAKERDRQLEAEKAVSDLTVELLNMATASARTQEERRRLQLEILDRERALARKTLARELDRDLDLTDADRTARLGQFDQATKAQRAGVERSTQGPLEAYRDTFLTTSAEIAEALQQVAVDGLKALNDGLLEAVLNAGKLGDVAQRVGDLVVAELERIALQRFILQPIADLLSRIGGGSLSGGGIWEQLAGFIGSAIGGGVSTGGSVSAHAAASSGRATGGPVYRGWSGLVGEQGRERFTAAADGYIADAATTARQMTDARARPAASSERGSGAGGGGEAVTVNLNNQTSTPMQAHATERRDPATGGRHLDVELFEMIDARIDQRFKSSLRGRRDDSDWAGQFGIRRRLTGG